MPLPPATVQRVPRHARAIRVEAFERADALWDIEARLTDTKPEAVQLATGLRAANDPVHDLWLRITIDEQMNVVEVVAVSDAVPYPGLCESIGPAYRELVGLNLLNGFRRGVRERLAGTAGCTHLTELAGVLPTAAVQAFAGKVQRRARIEGAHGSVERRPFQLDRCHALRTDGEAVRLHYPRWYRGPGLRGAGAGAGAPDTSAGGLAAGGRNANEPRNDR